LYFMWNGAVAGVRREQKKMSVISNDGKGYPEYLRIRLRKS
jgi:hypothetical protein